MMKCSTHSRALVAVLAFACAAFTAQSSQAQTAASSGSEITAKELLEKFPRSLISDSDFSSRKREEARDQLNQRLRDNLNNTSGTVTFQVEEVRKRQGKIVVMSTWVRSRIAGTPFNLHHEVEFAKGDEQKLAKLRKGEKITVSGRVMGVVYGKNDNLFNLWVREGKLVK